jgi:formamidopyrimidine-DNA glycosylase
MPELPDLEVIRQYLAPRLAGAEIASVDVPRPVIVRNLLGGDISSHLVGRNLAGVGRRGKFLLLSLSEPALWLAINPMLAGRLRYGEPLRRNRVRDALVIGLAGGHELRYHDARDMGKVYLTARLDQVPAFAGLGPDADDPELSLEVFRQRIRRHTGEVKGVLTEQSFVAGIGNAYSDEICWHAHLYPFRRRASLSPDDVARLYGSMREVLSTAIETLRVRVGEAIDVEIRDFLAVHGKPGQPCPRCGTPISQVTRQKRSTHFCRTCQPGLMVGRRDRSLP